jgi:hypothetical protein
MLWSLGKVLGRILAASCEEREVSIPFLLRLTGSPCRQKAHDLAVAVFSSRCPFSCSTGSYMPCDTGSPRGTGSATSRFTPSWQGAPVMVVKPPCIPDTAIASSPSAPIPARGRGISAGPRFCLRYLRQRYSQRNHRSRSAEMRIQATASRTNTSSGF